MSEIRVPVLREISGEICAGERESAQVLDAGENDRRATGIDGDLRYG